MKIRSVKLNGILNPVGFALETPVCSWKVTDTESKKAVYTRIEVSTDSDFRHLVYKKEGKDLNQTGEPLKMELAPQTRYNFRIFVKGDGGDEAVSETHFFETGKCESAWSADWICAKEDYHPLFSKLFTARIAEISSARLYVSGVGLFEVYLNGEKIGREYLTPYLTDYGKKIQTFTFPVEHLRRENKLEILAGKGWYMGRFGVDGESCLYGDKMAVIAELHICYADGSTQQVNTDESWSEQPSCVRDSGIYDGEIDDFAAVSDGKRVPVQVCPDSEELKKRLTDRASIPVCEQERIPVKEILHTPAGETVLDFGQNFAGYVEFRTRAPKDDRIHLEFGEILQGGNFYNENYRSAKNGFIYIADGKERTVRPHFTYYGFRYVRVSGWPGEVKASDFSGVVLFSDMERIGRIHTSNEMVNRLYENTVWGMKSNFLDMPTDCPQRDERLAWMGDAHIFAPAACWHMDTRAFYRKFLGDIRLEQQELGGGVPQYLPNPGHVPMISAIWGDAAAILPETLYEFFGDAHDFKAFYDVMRGWADYVDRLDGARGKRYLYDFGFTFGDWLALDGMTENSFKGNTDDAFLASLYYYHSVEVVAQAARLLNLPESAHYTELGENIRKAIIAEYFTETGRLAIDTQAGLLNALRFGVYVNREKTVGQLYTRIKKDGFRIRCGFAGAPILCSELARNGLAELAYDFLLNEKFPGWMYCVNLGATTVWERWNSVLPDGTMNPAGMNSLNHYSYGAVADFLYRYMAGIDPLEPGFSRVRLAPRPDIRVASAKASYDSPYGVFESGYEILSDGKIRIRIAVPFGATAEVVLPDSGRESFTVSAGRYEYTYMPIKDYRTPYDETTRLSRLAQDENAMRLLGKYEPAYAGIAASGDPEMGANTIVEMTYNSFIPCIRENIPKLLEELKELRVECEWS